MQCGGDGLLEVLPRRDELRDALVFEHLGDVGDVDAERRQLREHELRVLASRCAGLRPDALVFPSPTGGYMKRTRSSEGSRSWFASALKSAGLPRMTIHDLRRTAASLAVQSGANVKTVQRMLGHTSAAMTLDVYADLFDSDLDEVSGAMDAAARSAGIDALLGE